MNAPTRQPRNTLVSAPRAANTMVVSRIATGLFDVTNNGIADSLYTFNFSLVDLPGYTELTAMYQAYCIEKVEIWWRPEYTVLSDAGLASTAVNVEFASAIDTTGAAAPATADVVYQYQNVAHTGITQVHYRKIKPAYLLDNIAPSCIPLACSSPSSNWYGILVSVPACGAAMIFRSTVKYTVALIGLK